MQTFLPYPSFQDSAAILDRSRLGKQRLECKQMLRALLQGSGWRHHAATKMWEGFEYSLCQYAIVITTEWRRRGYQDQQLPYFKQLASTLPPGPTPWWLGHEDFHKSHRANLIRKDPVYYGRFGWKEEPTEGYWWPTHHR